MVQWTPEKDQLLLRGVFDFCDIKLSGPLTQHLADLIGEGCTPKAVNHRLSNLKKTGKPVKATGSSPTKNAPDTASGAGRGRDKKSESEPAANGEAHDDASPKPKKRGRPTKAEAEARKKIKVENVEHGPLSSGADEGECEVDEV